MKKIGILSIQGGIIEHYNMLNTLDNIKPILVKSTEDLKDINGIILPGGESTTIGKLLRDYKLLSPIRELILKGLPVWGTCAGMVLLAKSITDKKIVHLGMMDIEVKRNGYGSQNNSFQTQHIIPKVSTHSLPLIFIRAPYVTKAKKSVEIISILENKIIACRQDNMFVTSFHPELTKNNSFHKYFIDTFF